MHRFLTTAGLGLAALTALTLAPAAARAQYVQVYSPPVVVAPPPVVYSYYPAPTTVYYTPAPTTYSYYSPAPVTYSYYAPATTVYSSPALVTPGYITTRTYYGLGIFRPRGVYSQSYFTPTPVTAPVTSYYTPVFIR
jgi:hypothetical protein